MREGKGVVIVVNENAIFSISTLYEGGEEGCNNGK